MGGKVLPNQDKNNFIEIESVIDKTGHRTE